MGSTEPENFGSRTDKDEAREYLDHLLNNGCHDVNDNDETEMSLPDWYNEKLYYRGQMGAVKYRLLLFGGMLSGLIAVLAIPTILKVLICTRQSSNAAMSYRRYFRTILHVLTWYKYPLKPGSKSWDSIEMVRNGHNKASRKCHNKINAQITQKDLALTQFGFIGFATLSAEKCGINDIDFYESTIHMWRVIGYLLGIKDEYNLCTNSWSTTRKRLKLVMSEIYKPALENTNKEFNIMTKCLIDGLWPINTTLNFKSSIYATKSIAECKGCEYFVTDNFGDPSIKYKEFYKLHILQRFLISYIKFVTYYLYKYKIVRYYLNFRLWCNEIIMYYFPYIAIYKYGFRWSYVRIFTDDEEKYHQD